MVWHRILRRRQARRLGALAFAVAAAGGIVLVAWRRDRTEEVPARLSVELEGRRRPDGSTPPLAVWRLRYEGSELRVYRDALRVIQRCPGSPACTGSERGGTLALRLEAAGEYRAVAFSRPSAADGLTLQGDLTAARREGGTVQMSAPLVVY